MKKIRYGVIGIKGVGRLHISSAQINPMVELTALADVDDASARQKSKDLKVRYFTDHRDMLAAGIVDAVSIATPHYLLAPIALDCLMAGVHVLVEKPFAIRLSEADAVIRMAKAKNLKLCVGYQHRTFRSSRVMKRLMDAGTIGNLLRLLWTWKEFRPEIYYAPNVWRGTFRHAGGGVLMSQTSHELDLICWMVGKPLQVSAFMGNQLHKEEIEDIVCASVLFSSGALGSLQFSINQARGYSVRQVAGDRGVIVIEDVKSLTDDENDEILVGTYEDALPAVISQLSRDGEQPKISWEAIKLSDQSLVQKLLANLSTYRSTLKTLRKAKILLERVGLKTKNERPMGHSLLMNNFIDVILNGAEPIASGESARSTVELINALFLSAIRKKTVDLPIDPEEYDCLAKELSDGATRVPMLHQF